jgi:hypothetical protein
MADLTDHDIEVLKFIWGYDSSALGYGGAWNNSCKYLLRHGYLTTVNWQGHDELALTEKGIKEFSQQ